MVPFHENNSLRTVYHSFHWMKLIGVPIPDLLSSLSFTDYAGECRKLSRILLKGASGHWPTSSFLLKRELAKESIDNSRILEIVAYFRSYGACGEDEEQLAENGLIIRRSEKFNILNVTDVPSAFRFAYYTAISLSLIHI